MRFFRSKPAQRFRNYHRYRQLTRSDFRRVCAHCFRHEEEAGGEEHFVQDHFKPKHLPDVDPAEFSNLYWSCTGCNARQNKGTTWPSTAQWLRGERFCDPCDHDPVGTDYVETPAGPLKTLTPAGEFTNRHLRLSVRKSLLDCRTRRKNLKRLYQRDLGRLEAALRHFEELVGDDGPENQRQLLQTLEGLVEAYGGFVGREPFTVGNVPPTIPSEIELILTAS